MNIHPEHDGGFAEPRVAQRKSYEHDDWMENAHVKNIVQKFPHIVVPFERALSSRVLTDAILHASEYTHDVLAQRLAADLQEAFTGLEGGIPQTLRDLDVRDAEKLDSTAIHRTAEEARVIEEESRTGGLSDYFSHRLMGVSSMLDLAAHMPLPAPLELSLRREADKLATLLVACEQADRKQEEDLSVAAK